MKKVIIAMVALFSIVAGAKAMSYEQAREQALFLTDKMAYELNLNDAQYDAAYEINLDYLMDVNTVDDVYAVSWSRRNIDMQVILLDWQWNAFCAASYFYRPLYWSAGLWHFGIYAYYPQRDFFYFSRPSVWISYRGGHCWRVNGGHSWYRNCGTRFHSGGHGTHTGMRDSYHHNGTSRYRGSMSGNRDNSSHSGRTGSVSRESRTGSNFRESRTGSSSYVSNHRSNERSGLSNNGERSGLGNDGERSGLSNNSERSGWGGNHSRRERTTGTTGADNMRQSSTRSTVENSQRGRYSHSNSNSIGSSRSTISGESRSNSFSGGGSHHGSFGGGGSRSSFGGSGSRSSFGGGGGRSSFGGGGGHHGGMGGRR